MRTRLRLTLAAAAIVAAMLPAVVSAHQPEANLGSPDPGLAYAVPRPDISRSIRGIVPAGGRDWYSFDLAVPTDLTLWLLTPATPACDGFSPTMIVYATDGSAAARFDGSRWYGATVASWLESDGGWRLAAPTWGWFTHGETSRSGPWARPRLPAGSYWLAVEAPPARGGAYTFAIGDLEIPGGGVDPGLTAWWRSCPPSWSG